MPLRINPAYGVLRNNKYVYGLEEIPALCDMHIGDDQVPMKRLIKMSKQELDSIQINNIVRHEFDRVYYKEDSSSEEKIDYDFHITYTWSPRFTTAELDEKIRVEQRREIALLNDEADRAKSSLLKQYGDQDPDYLAWVQYDADLEAKRVELDSLRTTYANATNPETEYAAWVELDRTWRSELPAKPGVQPAG